MLKLNATVWQQKMEMTWGTAESEAKDRNSWRKRNDCIILNG